jgi:putative transposase
MATKTNPIKSELIDELLSGRDPKTLFESEGLLDELKKALAERVLNAEMDHHLGQDPEQAAGNHRNGSSSKTVLTDSGKLELSIPRDRHGRFDPQLIAKYQRRFPGFDQKVIALYARGMSTRDIQGHLRELYGVEISPELVSAVTDAVLEEVSAWQNRPLESVYAVVFFDACGSRSVTRAWSRTRRCTWQSACAARGTRRSWAFGSSKPRGRSSGCA